jgi:hypothetical protein
MHYGLPICNIVGAMVRFSRLFSVTGTFWFAFRIIAAQTYENIAIFSTDHRIRYSSLCASDVTHECQGHWMKYRDQRFSNGIAMLAQNSQPGEVAPYFSIPLKSTLLT